MAARCYFRDRHAPSPRPSDDRVSASSFQRRLQDISPAVQPSHNATTLSQTNDDHDCSFLQRLSSDGQREIQAYPNPTPLPTSTPVKPGLRKDDLVEQLTGTVVDPMTAIR
jgi:hypothetical protein